MQSSAIDALKGMLGDNADEKISAVLGALSSKNAQENNDLQEKPISAEAPAVVPALDQVTADSLMQIKNIVDNFANSGNDSRANLLLSLKPYMRSSRQSSIDTAIRLLNLSKLSGIFKLR